jgi:hypothetical protein
LLKTYYKEQNNLSNIAKSITKEKELLKVLNAKGVRKPTQAELNSLNKNQQQQGGVGLLTAPPHLGDLMHMLIFLPMDRK